MGIYGEYRFYQKTKRDGARRWVNTTPVRRIRKPHAKTEKGKPNEKYPHRYSEGWEIALRLFVLKETTEWNEVICRIQASGPGNRT